MATKAKRKKRVVAKPPRRAPKTATRAKPTRPAAANGAVIPCMRYDNAPAAIEFLCKAFGFKKHLVVPGENGTVMHAELAIGNGMVMCGSNVKSDFGRMMALPNEIGGRETQTAYIVLDIKSEDYGGRGYTCRDPEGHIWTFGSYDPWKMR